MRRYIYYPDHLVDVSGPDLSSPLRILAWLWAKCSDLAREPLYQNALPSLIAYTQHRRRAKPAPRALRPSYPLQHVPDDVIKDLSVGEYFTKAMGGRRDVVDNMISALMHGVYAADVWQQSMQSSIFSSLLMDEYAPGRPSHVRLDLQEWYLALELTAHDDGFRKAATTLSRAEYLSFHGGFTTLTDAIAADLRSNKNVTIRLNEPVTQIRNYQHKVAVRTKTRASWRLPWPCEKADAIRRAIGLDISASHAGILRQDRLDHPRPTVGCPDEQQATYARPVQGNQRRPRQLVVPGTGPRQRRPWLWLPDPEQQHAQPQRPSGRPLRLGPRGHV